MREIKQIIIHCSATKPTQNITAKNIERWHVEERGWRAIGYHYVITRAGDLEKGRDIDDTGAHALGYNANSIGVCLVGGLDDNGKPEQNYTANQYYSLKKLLDVLCVTFPDAVIMGHNEVSDKACPCFNVGEWWNGVQQR